MIFSIIIFSLSCQKYNENDFDFSVSTNKSEFQIGEDIIITINGGMDKALIYPVLAKYNSNNEIIEFRNLLNEVNSPSQYSDCCSYEGIGGPYTTTWLEDGLICNCDIIDDIQHVQELQWNGTEYIPNEFYWSDEKFKIIIIDPFVDEEGRNEVALAQTPLEENIITESEYFTIIYTSKNCDSPKSLNAKYSLNTASLTWNEVKCRSI